ncbi:MAG TPA: pyridoxal 5'-phosphate synthase glutaminase subunit PdxT [Candidatus Kapabacteria bacterium]|nr:pyridoxal 5'-phosphate synthase glutaminase subunit PdxT [Candidatus Kapabacteria bacterium]
MESNGRTGFSLSHRSEERQAKACPTIGVLSLQGDFREHIEKLESLGAETRDVRRTSDLDNIDALIIPGGESTAVAILEQSEAGRGIFDTIRKLGEEGLPIWGTCMGSILLAKNIEGSTQGRLGLMDITIRRNAFGPQRFSSEEPLHIPAIGAEDFPGAFIRAPLITQTGPGVEVLGEVDRGIVMAREKNLLATVFHPEVVDDARVHRYFLSMIERKL